MTNESFRIIAAIIYVAVIVVDIYLVWRVIRYANH